MRMNRAPNIIRILFIIMVSFALVGPAIGQTPTKKIRLKVPPAEKTTKPANTDPVLPTKPKQKKKFIQKKDKWLAVGLSLMVAGGGHFYVGNISSGIIYFLGTYGSLGIGVASMLSAHQTRDVLVDGNKVREIDNTNEPLYLVGALFFTSSVLFFVGNVLDTFTSVREYNRRIERINRYAIRHKKTDWYLANRKRTLYAGGTYRF